MNRLIYGYCNVVAAGQGFDLSNDIEKKRLIGACLFVERKLSNSSWLIRTGIFAFSAYIAVNVFIFKGRSLNDLTLLDKKSVYYALKASRISIKRDFLKFYESFVTLYWYQLDQEL